jgi:cytidylate kinase
MTEAAFVIAIDGPAASGKGTLARRLARHYGLTYLDTGSLYRAVARDLLASGADPGDATAAATAAAGIDPQTLADPGLRDELVGRTASKVAAYPEVRQALLDFQRRIAATPPGAVLDGRDIGTVVCPAAQAKLFVVADVETRARRRWSELSARGADIDMALIRRDLEQRDRQDAARSVAPLRPAGDAQTLDTSNLSIEQVFERAVAMIGRSRDG